MWFDLICEDMKPRVIGNVEEEEVDIIVEVDTNQTHKSVYNEKCFADIYNVEDKQTELTLKVAPRHSGKYW